MTTRLIKTLNGAYNTQVRIYKDYDWGEYQVRIPGQPDATYHTDGIRDAEGTAALMLADLEIGARDAATQGAAQ